MIGIAFALLSACGYGLADASIAKGARLGMGDNGVLLSVMFTAALSLALWLLMGTSLNEVAAGQGAGQALIWFVAGGVLSNVLARAANFRSVALAGVARASTYRRLIPVFALVFSFFLLGEAVDGMAAIGSLVILAGFLVVLADRTSSPASGLARAGLVYGLVAAFCYGASYVARKLGMIGLPDPVLGAAVGALTGVLWHLLCQWIGGPGRAKPQFGRWQVLTAGGMAVGQSSQFLALHHTNVGVVAAIGSLEMVIGPLLSAFVLRSDRGHDRRTLAASALAIVGVALIAFEGAGV